MVACGENEPPRMGLGVGCGEDPGPEKERRALRGSSSRDKGVKWRSSRRRYGGRTHNQKVIKRRLRVEPQKKECLLMGWGGDDRSRLAREGTRGV